VYTSYKEIYQPTIPRTRSGVPVGESTTNSDNKDMKNVLKVSLVLATQLVLTANLPAQQTVRGVNGPVHVIVSDAIGNIYVGGNFDRAGDVTAFNIAKWDGSAWSAVGEGVTGPVYAIAIDGSDIYVGGNFSQAGISTLVIPAKNLAKWNGSSWSNFGSGLDYDVAPNNSQVRAILPAPGDWVYVGGAFSRAGGNVAANVAVWDGASWSAMGAGMSGTVNALTYLGAQVVAGGPQIRAWNSASGTWNPLVGANGLPTEIEGIVHCFELGYGGTLFVGGNFSYKPYPSFPGHENMAQFTVANGWERLPNSAKVDGTVFAMAAKPDVNGREIYAVGSMSSVTHFDSIGYAVNRMARWSITDSKMYPVDMNTIDMASFCGPDEEQALAVRFTPFGFYVGGYSINRFRHSDNTVLECVDNIAFGRRLGSSSLAVTWTSLGNQAPNISITSPANGTTYYAPADVTVSSSLTDDCLPLCATVTAVVRNASGQPVSQCSDLTEPYSCTIEDLPVGQYTITVTARDCEGGARSVVSGSIYVVSIPTVYVSVSDASAAEAGPNTGTFRVIRSGSISPPLTVRYTVGGSAQANVDYASLSGTVYLAPGVATSDPITVTPIEDELYEGNETVILNLSADPAYVISSGSGTVSINSLLDLGVVSGDVKSVGSGISAAGRASGASYDSAGAPGAVRTSPNAPINSSTDDLNNYFVSAFACNGTSFAFDIEDTGTLVRTVGDWTCSGVTRPFYRYDSVGGAQTETLLLPGADRGSARDIHNGAIAGYAIDQYGTARAYWWSTYGYPANAAAYNFGATFIPSYNSWGMGLHSNGKMVGFYQDPYYGNYPFLIDNLYPSFIRLLASGYPVPGEAYAINSSYKIAGWYQSGPYKVPASWTYANNGTAPTATALTVLSGQFHGIARDVNDNGRVVGHCYTPANPTDTDHRACLWNGTTATDLNAALPPGSGWVLHVVYGINNGGQIVGYGTLNGQIRGFVMTP
jgi:hypothetical protein